MSTILRNKVAFTNFYYVKSNSAKFKYSDRKEITRLQCTLRHNFYMFTNSNSEYLARTLIFCMEQILLPPKISLSHNILIMIIQYANANNMQQINDCKNYCINKTELINH